MKPLIMAVVLGAGLAAAGCASTPASRINSNREVYNSYPMEVQEMIAAGEVAVGFTPEQVRMALGNPDRVATRTDPDGTSEVWIYRDKRSRVGFGLGVGIGGGGGSTRVGTSVGIGTGGRYYDDERMRVVIAQGAVTAVEQVHRR